MVPLPPALWGQGTHNTRRQWGCIFYLREWKKKMKKQNKGQREARIDTKR
jgi:hypothetical protein